MNRTHALAVLSAIRRPRRKRKVGRIPRPLPPTRIAEAYAKAIRDRVCALARACFDEHAGEILHLLAERRRSMGRTDADGDRPRVPAGSPEGGEFAPNGGASTSTTAETRGAVLRSLEVGDGTAEIAGHSRELGLNGFVPMKTIAERKLKPGDIKAMRDKAEPESTPVTQVKLEHLVLTQSDVDVAPVRKMIGEKAGDLPPVIVFRINGKHYLIDGTHRTVAAALRGDKTISAKVVDPPDHRADAANGIGKAIGRAAQLGAKAAESDEQQARSIAAALSAAERAGRKQYERERRSTSAALTGATIEGRYAGRLLDRAAREFAEKFHPTALHAVVKQFGRRTDEHSRQQLDQQLRSAIGVPLSTIEKPARDKIDGWAAANVDRIVTVPETYFDRLRLDVEEAFEDGTRPEDLADSFVERYGMSERQAELIARDQTLKLAADLNHDRMQSLGVERAIWRTMNDERVSEDCAEHEGEEFDLATGIDGAFPGSEHPMCRCYSEPILDALIPDVDDS